MLRSTLFKVCYWNDFTDREIVLFRTTDYAEAEKQCYTMEAGEVRELYIKKVAVTPKAKPKEEPKNE